MSSVLQHTDKSSPGNKAASTSSLPQQYPLPVRRIRNTAVLVKWIEEHQFNPYPTKAEKQYLAYYSGMNLTQLSTWFANVRRRIRKIGVKTWLEERCTSTIDSFPSVPTRPTHTEYPSHGVYNPSILANPYSYSSIPYALHQQVSVGLSRVQPIQTNPCNTDLPMVPTSIMASPSSSSISLNYGLYSSTLCPVNQPLLSMCTPSWPDTAAASSLFPNSSSVDSMHSCPTSNTGPTPHSPLTAQVYSTLDMGEGGSSALSQPSPYQMLPECASWEPSASRLN